MIRVGLGQHRRGVTEKSGLSGTIYPNAGTRILKRLPTPFLDPFSPPHTDGRLARYLGLFGGYRLRNALTVMEVRREAGESIACTSLRFKKAP